MGGDGGARGLEGCTIGGCRMHQCCFNTNWNEVENMFLAELVRSVSDLEIERYGCMA